MLDFDILLVILGKLLRMPYPEIKIRQVKVTYNINSDNKTQMNGNYL